MKKQYLFVLLAALLAFAGCSERDYDAAGTFTMEVTIPEGTPSADAVYIAGPFNAEVVSDDWLLSPKHARLRTIELDPEKFVSGKTLEDGFWFVSAALGRELDEDGQGVSHTLKAHTGYTYKVSVSRWSSEVEGEDITERMLNGQWALVGTHNEWRLSLAYNMEKSGNERVHGGLNCSGEDSFKLVLDGSWLVNFGYGNPGTSTVVHAGKQVTLVRDGGNVRPEAGLYTVKFNPSICALILEKTGEYTPPPAPDSWAVTGKFNGWNAAENCFPLTRGKDGKYTASFVNLMQATSADGGDAGFLLAKNGSMDGFLGLAGGRGTVSLDVANALAEEGGVMLVPENGFYEFILDPENNSLSVTPSPAAAMSSWSIVGKFNDWDPTTGILMYTYGNWHIAFSVELTQMLGETGGMGFKFVKNKSWDNNRGYTGYVGGEGGHKVVELDTEIPLSQGGGNIQLVEDGTYDVYMNTATDKAFILEAGAPFLH